MVLGPVCVQLLDRRAGQRDVPARGPALLGPELAALRARQRQLQQPRRPAHRRVPPARRRQRPVAGGQPQLPKNVRPTDGSGGDHGAVPGVLGRREYTGALCITQLCAI